jgi:hypothetical protein
MKGGTMGKERKGVEKTLALGVSLIRKVWVNIVLFLLSGIIIGSGFYLRSQPGWIIRADLREYNRGVSAYEELLWAPLISSEEMLLSIYPHVIERAGAHFDNVDLSSTDRKLKSLSLYNLGTMIARLAFFDKRARSTRAIDTAQAILKLEKAIRNDPNNEEAKINLELLESILIMEEKEKGGPGQGYSPGVVEDKGF